MALVRDNFFWMLLSLPSFPLFVLYLTLVFTYRYWKKGISAKDLTWLLPGHNLCCILLSLVASLVFFWCFAFRADSLYSKTSDSLLDKAFLIYSFSKSFELLDTVYMMLRHKGRQLSFLHIYHHSAMLLLSDSAYRFFPWPCVAFCLAVNSVVHIFVYGYYYLACYQTIGTRAKRFITEIQLAQFTIGLLYYIPGFLYHGFCIYGLIFDATMIALFGNFYIRAYCLGKTKSA